MNISDAVHPAGRSRRRCSPWRIALAGVRRRIMLLPVSPLPQVEFPTIQVSASLPGASPETMASSVATPLERQFGRIAGRHRDDLDELARLDQHHAAVRPEPQHRRRRARRAGGDQRRARPAAGEPAEQPDLPQGQPGRRADHDPRAHLRHVDRGRRCTTPPSPILAAEALAGRRASGRCSSAAARCRRCGSRSIPTRPERASASASRTCAPRSPRPTPTGRRASSATASRPGASRPTTSSTSASEYRPLDHRLHATARAVRLARRRRRVTDSVEDIRNARPVPTASPPSCSSSSASRARTSSRPSTASEALLPQLAGLDPAGDRRSRWPSIARRRSAPRCTTSRSRCCISIVPRDPRRLRLPARACARRSSRASPCRSR